MWFALLAACGSPCAPGPEPEVALGAGDLAYAPLSDGDAVDIVYGSQGGYHVDLALDARGFDADETVSAALSGAFDGEEVAFGDPWFALTCNPASRSQQAWGLRLIFDGLVPPDLDGRTLQVRAVVTDARGVQASSERSIVLVDPL